MTNVYFDQLSNSIVGKFVGFLSFEEHQKLGDKILKQALHEGCFKLIIDTSDIRIIKKETQEWIMSDWFPRAIEQGIKYMAFITPRDVIAQMSTIKVNGKPGRINIKYFKKTSDALTWIISK